MRPHSPRFAIACRQARAASGRRATAPFASAASPNGRDLPLVVARRNPGAPRDEEERRRGDDARRREETERGARRAAVPATAHASGRGERDGRERQPLALRQDRRAQQEARRRGPPQRPAPFRGQEKEAGAPEAGERKVAVRAGGAAVQREREVGARPRRAWPRRPRGGPARAEAASKRTRRKAGQKSA